MKRLTYSVFFALLFPFFFSIPSVGVAKTPALIEKEKEAPEEWSYYMEHVVHLLDYVESMAGLKDVFATEIKSNLDLFERKQRALDFIAVTEEYLSFLEKYRDTVAAQGQAADLGKENEKIQSLGSPSLDQVRSNVVLAMQTKTLLDKMIAENKTWSYKKKQLVFKDIAIQEHYKQLHEKLANLDQPVVESSMLTQKQ